MGRRLVASACLAILAAIAVPVTNANHPQIGHGDAIVFDHKAGNAWWVEVTLAGGASGSVATVQAMDTGGPWVTLTKRSWGAWAASFHIEPGHQVRFRASWAGGDMVDSCWFDHPSGVEVCTQPFDATFDGVRGNEWWVQAHVTPNSGHAVMAVDVRFDDGPWLPLTKQSWGTDQWARSYHVSQGTKVQLRALDFGEVEDLSFCHKWIPAQGQDAPQMPCSPPPGFEATFTDVKGNDWWVEVKVAGTWPLEGVDARLGCSDNGWIPLTLRSWGAWAGSFRVWPGTHVDFRARAASGANDVSDAAYIWPAATPTDPCDAEWPRDSSFAQVRFRVEDRWSDVDGEHYRLADGLVSTRFSRSGGGFWDGTCEQRVSTRSPSGVWTNVTETHAWDAWPPLGQVPATVGGVADVQQLENCALTHALDQPVVGRETRTFSIRTSSGDMVPIDAYHAANSGTGFNEEWWWDARHGLMLDWDLDAMGGSNSRHADGWLLNTDAELG